MLLWPISIFCWSQCLKEKFKFTDYDRKIFYISNSIFLLLSFTSLYWNAVYAKDIFSLSLVFICLRFLVCRKYLSAAFFLLIACMLRPYSIVFVFSVYLWLVYDKFLNKVACFIFVIYLVAISYFTSWALPLNSILLAGFSFLSPNPFNFNNWDYFVDNSSGWTFSPLLFTIEGLLISCCLIYSTTKFILSKVERKFLTQIILPFMFISVTLALVGYIHHVTNGNIYGFGVLGDNMIRKKIGLWPLISIIFSYTIFKLFRKNKF